MPYNTAEMKKIRNTFRGYKHLKRTNKLGAIAELRLNLMGQKLLSKETRFQKFFFGTHEDAHEKTIRQFLLSRLCDTNFNQALLQYHAKENQKLAYAFPKAWLQVLRKSDIQIAPYRSSLLWAKYVFLMYGNGIFYIFRMTLLTIKAFITTKETKQAGSVFFESLTNNNLPKETISTNPQYDIFSWYLKWANANSKVEIFHHTAPQVGTISINGRKILKIKDDSSVPRGGKSRLLFIFWASNAIFYSIWNLLLGRWWVLVMLKEAAKRKLVELQDQASLAMDYLFNNTSALYRPLWTYEAERRGSRIILYFYSANNENFKKEDGYGPEIFGWQTMTWPHYLVWDEYQKLFVERVTASKPKIEIVGPIWFFTTAGFIPELRSAAAAVFDVQPMRLSRYILLGLDNEYYVPEIANGFLLDIHDVLQDYHIAVLYKKKREIGRLSHPIYRQFIKKLEVSENFMGLEASVSPNEVIAKTHFTISMPFTSTALIAAHMGKPSIYYDPSGLIQKDDRAAHGITVISGKQELASWVNQLLKQNFQA